VPAKVRWRLAEVGDGLDAISPVELSVWQSLEESTAQIDVRGWRIIYRIDATTTRSSRSASFVGS
jgi:hypothetical protein